jgi:dTDP-4-dehydrorhamnose reductase
LTGASGQVGGALLPLLARLGNVISPDRARFDLGKPQGLAAALDQIAPELIINPAAYTAVDKAEDEPELALRVNAEAPGVIARWAADRGVPLIHFSTDYVFDGSGERPWREDDPTGPLGAYGASKLAGEAEILTARGPSLIVRTSWVYAATGKNFLRTIARAAREREVLRVVADQIGAPTSAALIADAVEHMVAPGLPNLARRSAQARGLVHLSASGTASWHQFAGAIVAGLKDRGVTLAAARVEAIRTQDYPARAARPRNSRLALDRLAQVFGQTPPSWQAALAPELDQLAREMADTARG